VFADQFFKAQNPQSRDRAGMGTSRMIIRRANTYGTISGTQNPLDLAIAGPGMFILAKQLDPGGAPTENPQKFHYTRNGQFAVDAKNRIVNENGMHLVGYAADSNGNVITNTKSVLTMDSEPLPQVPTRESTININIDNRRDTLAGRAFDHLDPASYSQSTSQTVYDSKGKSHVLSVYYKKVNTADLTLTDYGSTGTTLKFGVTQSLGTTLNGEQTDKIATTAVASSVTGSTQTLSNSKLTYLSGGVEGSNGVKTTTGLLSGNNERGTITFRAMVAGDTITVAGLTLTASGAVTAADVATAFATGTAATNSSFSGTLSNWKVLSKSSSDVTFVSNSLSSNVSDLTATGSRTTLASASITQGSSTVGSTVTESAVVTFRDLSPGQSVSVGGRTFTAGSAGATASQVATAMAQTITLTSGTSADGATVGSFSGAISNWTTGTLSSGNLTFTSTTSASNVTDLAITNTPASLNTTPTSFTTTYIDGIYKNVALTGMTSGATGAFGTVTVLNGVVTNLTITETGSGYTAGETLVGSFGGNDVYKVIASIDERSSAGTGAGKLGAAYNLKLNDGTILTVKQSSFGGATDPTYTVAVDRYAVFSTIDSIPVGSDTTGTGQTNIKLDGNTNKEQISLGTMAFVAGKNLDSLARDAYGKSQFITKVTINAGPTEGDEWGQTANGGAINFSLFSTDTTGYASSAQTYTNTQDGSPTAQLTAYSFDSYGKLVAQYDNGKSIVKGQLILATFNNFEGLVPVGGNGFQASAVSGDPLEDTPNGSQMGAIRAQPVEESNVDLTQQLVKLMVLQRAYSAASQATKVQVATLVDDTLRIGQ
jgi:flagellar hook-basal body protein